MKYNILENPVLWVIEFSKDGIVHNIIAVVLLCLAILIVYISRNTLKDISTYIKKPYKYLQLVLDRYQSNLSIREIERNHNKILKIEKSTKKYIKELSDKKKQYSAVQQLLEFPTPKGYCHLIKFIVKLERPDERNDLLYAMHKNAKRSWYASIK